MHIYRIQDKQGRGPFKPGFTVKWNEGREDMANLEPWYCEWPGLDPTAEKAPDEHVGCGCTSLDQLRRWFTETEYNRLRVLGYNAVRLDADRLLRSSDIQSVFARNRALRKGATVIALYA